MNNTGWTENNKGKNKVKNIGLTENTDKITEKNTGWTEKNTGKDTGKNTG